MTYVYILVSVADPTRHYVGATGNLKQRLADHNSGKVTHTAKYMPWDLNTYIGFRNRDRAFAFEKYLKSRSGRALPGSGFSRVTSTCEPILKPNTASPYFEDLPAIRALMARAACLFATLPTRQDIRRSINLRHSRFP